MSVATAISRPLLPMALVGLALTGAAPASAQAPVTGPGVQVGGQVLSTLQLGLSAPSSALATFPKRSGKHVYTVTINATVTTTDAPTYLTIADGGSTGGSTLGHLVAGTAVLPQPLQVSSGGAFMSLASPVVPVLDTWTQPVSNQAANLQLQQVVGGSGTAASATTGPYTKVVLVSLSADVP